jgi:16S rRNA (cytidine1402-2'-O)-methyltransferase
MTNKGKLFLIPNVIADETQENVITKQVRDVLPSIKSFVVEDLRTARRYLSSLKIYPSIEALAFSVLNKDTKVEEIGDLLEGLLRGENIGVISESGCPGVADPGSLAVSYAHKNEVEVVPLVGPSSLLLALMASGLNGQKFAFHGYLPVESKELARALRTLEEDSRRLNQTQLLIETPYRNNQMLKSLVATLNPKTHLCVALDVTGAGQLIKTKTVEKWRSQSIEMPKKPAVFLFLA